MTRVRKIGVDYAFFGWLRENELLDSRRAHLSCVDFDVIIHRFPDRRSTNPKMRVDHMMVIETKSHARGPMPVPFYQCDTHRILNAVWNSEQMRSRGITVQIPGPDGGREQRRVRWWGVHVLAMSGDRPDNSKAMWWNRRHEPIDVPTLEALIRFELDPFILAPIDWRDHHQGELGYKPLRRVIARDR